jgi:outer membrane protein assembly factor BamB
VIRFEIPEDTLPEAVESDLLRLARIGRMIAPGPERDRDARRGQHAATQRVPMVQHQPPPPLVVMTFHDRLVAMNAHTGQRAWEFQTDANAGVGRLFVDQGLVFYVAGSSVYCVDYLTGASRWRAPNPFTIFEANVLVYAGCLVLMANGEAACLNAQNGAQLWHDKFKGYGTLGGAMAAPGVTAQIDRRR